MLSVQRTIESCIIGSMSFEDDIKDKAIELGFDAVGITDSSVIGSEQVEYFSEWIGAGYAGRMEYMQRDFEKRIDPSKLLENARSVIVVGLNYKPVRGKAKAPDAARPPRDRPAGRVADYALYEDYHPFMKERLRKLGESINSMAGEDVRFKICVDSAPLAERALAVRAGLGFVGKNRMVINHALGPEIFLAEIVTTVKLQADKAISGNCGDCTKCLEACPTGALRADGQFDATKCISYLTIEYKGAIADEQAQRIGNRLFGCDECVAACPHQIEAPACGNKQFRFYPRRSELELEEVLRLSGESFGREFGDSPIKRLGPEGLKRNARICATNAMRSK